MTLVSAAILLFLVMDPIGSIPLVLTSLQRVDSKRVVRVVIRELFIALAVLMVFPRREGQGEDLDGEPFVVPLAIPYVAGPSTMTTMMLIMSREPARWPIWLAALGIAWGATAIILMFASYLPDALGRRALTAAERLMGMVLIAISIQMLMDGIQEAWSAF